jgi:hypothetical protein
MRARAHKYTYTHTLVDYGSSRSRDTEELKVIAVYLLAKALFSYFFSFMALGRENNRIPTVRIIQHRSRFTWIRCGGVHL